MQLFFVLRDSSIIMKHTHTMLRHTCAVCIRMHSGTLKRLKKIKRNKSRTHTHMDVQNEMEKKQKQKAQKNRKRNKSMHRTKVGCMEQYFHIFYSKWSLQF